ncbi:MAG: hypothetical protein GDA50_02060 [Alphaproteobacteria bacterium GM202ARS2]|nr:hypothetical protein [Alphaproteobacteria bacterium GM202ARS2]
MVQKKPEDMTLEELIEHQKSHKVGEKELIDQAMSIALTEDRRHGGDTSLEEMERIAKKDRVTGCIKNIL